MGLQRVVPGIPPFPKEELLLTGLSQEKYDGAWTLRGLSGMEGLTQNLYLFARFVTRWNFSAFEWWRGKDSEG